MSFICPNVSSGPTIPSYVPDGYSLAFEDTFQALDCEKWSSEFIWNKDKFINGEPQLIINGEDQYYVDICNGEHDALGISSPASFGSDGLTITASPLDTPLSAVDGAGDTVQQEYSSVVLTSRENFNFLYGYVEARMKPPCDAEGSWSAFWLLNKDYGIGSAGPNGVYESEIDVVENVQGNGYTNQCAPQAYHHRDQFGTRWTLDGGGVRKDGVSDSRLFGDCQTGQIGNFNSNCLPAGESYCDDFHTYGCLWTEDKFELYIDGVLTNSVCESGSIPQHNMYMILNLAVGGFFPGPPNAAHYPASAQFDYVRVYQP